MFLFIVVVTFAFTLFVFFVKVLYIHFLWPNKQQMHLFYVTLRRLHVLRTWEGFCLGLFSLWLVMAWSFAGESTENC